MTAIPKLLGLEGIIESRPDYREGRPYIAGTGVSVGRVSILYNREGMSADEIADEMGLTPEQSYAALAYYFRNKAAIDEDLKARDKQEAQLEAKYGRKGSARRAT